MGLAVATFPTRALAAARVFEAAGAADEGAVAAAELAAAVTALAAVDCDTNAAGVGRMYRAYRFVEERGRR